MIRNVQTNRTALLGTLPRFLTASEWLTIRTHDARVSSESGPACSESLPRPSPQPVLGFLLPWVGIRIFTWVGTSLVEPLTSILWHEPRRRRMAGSRQLLRLFRSGRLIQNGEAHRGDFRGDYS